MGILRARCGMLSLYLLIFWAKARRSAMAVAADVLKQIPRQAGSRQTPFSTQYDHRGKRENRRMDHYRNERNAVPQNTPNEKYLRILISKRTRVG